MASTPSFVATPKVGIALVSTANANRDGTGTIETVFSAGANGSRIERVVVEARSTTTAGMIRLFLHNGTTAFLWREVAVSAVTPSATVKTFREEIAVEDLVLQTGYSLRASTHNAENFNLIAFGGDL